MNKPPRKLGRLVWYASILSFVAIIIAISASWLLYKYTVQLLTDNLRERLLTISITQAANIDARDIEALQTKDDWQKPEWTEVVNRLHKAKYSNDSVVFMYIFRRIKDNPRQMEFVADADSLDPFANDTEDPLRNIDVNRDGKVEPDGPDKLQWPGQPYPEAADIPEIEETYATGPLTAKDLYTDEYGTVLTGYAPIKDENGNIVAILGTDIKADDFSLITRQTLYPFLLFIAFLVIIIVSLTMVIVYIWKKQAADLAEANKQQEKLNEELIVINEKLKEVDRQKTEFISVASHQLRGPLTAIKGYASLILEGDFGKLSQEMKEGVETIFKSTQALVVIVGDYLDVSRIEQGRMRYDFSDFDLKPLVETIVNEFQPNIHVSGLTLDTDFSKADDCFVHADQGKLKQVISNLIDNAIKYTPRGSIHISLVRTNNDKIQLRVKDTGVGIDKDIIPKLFDKFSRAPGASQTNISGTGLGLYVAKKMMEAHRGHVWAESEGKGKGSTFVMEIDAIHKTPNALNNKLESTFEKVNNEMGPQA